MNFDNLLGTQPLLVILDRINKRLATVGDPPACIVIKNQDDLGLFRRSSDLPKQNHPSTLILPAMLERKMSQQGIHHVLLFGRDGDGTASQEVYEVE